MNKVIVTLIIGFIFILIVDNIYLKFAKDTVYKNIIDPKETINIYAALLCWVVIVISIQLIVLSRPDLNSENVFLYGAMLGCASYAMYNLTNFATYPSRWTVNLVLIDTLWGTILTGTTAYIMYKCANL
jgi:hypothetical protein